MLKILKTIGVLSTSVALLAVSVVPSFASQNAMSMTTYHVNLTELNNSGVWGNVKIMVQGDQLTAKVQVHNLEENQMHMQHIHGLADNSNATCPTMSADTNHDGIVSLVEGLPFYGSILLPLTPYPMANSNGNEQFKNTFTINSADLMPLVNRTVVLHGMTINGSYDATVPVACGQITWVRTTNNHDNDNDNDNNGHRSSTGITISGNGSDSHNTVNVSSSRRLEVSQTNSSEVSNTVVAHANTGGNQANKNTGGDVSIDTGSSSLSIMISNMINRNLLSF